MLDAAHAAVVEQVVRELSAGGWRIETEVSFNVYGERGSIDVLAFASRPGTVLVVEAKSILGDIQETLMTLDRKARIARALARERGWDVRAVARLLVIREGRTARRRVAEHPSMFANAFPIRGVAARRWLRAPTAVEPFAGLWFLSGESHTVVRRRIRRTVGRVVHPDGPGSRQANPVRSPDSNRPANDRVGAA